MAEDDETTLVEVHSADTGRKRVEDEYVASRVTLLDAHEIDEDLVQILKSQLSQVLKYLPSWVLGRFNSEIEVVLRLLMYQQSVLRHHSTFVQHMFQLTYSNIADSRFKTILFIISNVLGDYTRRKSDEISMYMRGQGKSPYLTFKYLDIAVDVLKLGNFLVFLNQGRYYSIMERIFRMRLVSKTRAARSIEYTYLSRELLYQSITELLLILIPLLQSHLLLRKLSNWFSTRNLDTSITKTEVPVLNLNSKCDGCNRFPWQPYHIECRHVFCYYCLVANCKLADDKYECCICSHTSEKVHSFATNQSIP